MSSGRIRSVSTHQVVALTTGWSWCVTPPGFWATPGVARARPAGVRWQRAPGLGAAGGLLRTAEPGTAPPAGRLDSVDWWWRRRIGPLAAGAPWWLEADGLATVAEVWLRDTAAGGEVRLLTSRNMFLSHEVPMPPVPEEGAELWLCVRSLDAELAARRPRPRWRVPMVSNQQLRWLRTTLLGRTRGWSPPVPPVGAWRPMRLVQRVMQPGVPRLHAHVDGKEGVLDVQLRMGTPERPVELIELALTRGTVVLRKRLAMAPDGLWHGQLRVDQPALWWPHTHGEPALYEARLMVRAMDGHMHSMALGPVGFRRVAVEAAEGDFKVVVNGVQVFCRGAVWTPLDVMRWRDNPQAVRAAVAQARVAGMNMLRVAGTMTYESSAFFDACDAEGVMVWQDFMFANMDYPSDDATWQADAVQEVNQQLDQWQARACLAVVCGNSEVQQQAAMWGAERALWAPPWFHRTLAELVEKALPGTAYWPSSAMGGAFPFQPDTGTTSYYGVGAYRRDVQDARLSGLRFATECLALAQPPDATAIARMPGGDTLRLTDPGWKARVPRDLGAGWDFDDVRDHYMARLFEVDPAVVRQRDHERYLMLARITCAEVMAGAMAEWRRIGSVCRGALILWLRDLWAGPGWGVLDELGRPKAAWHALRRVQQPCAVLLSDEGLNGLRIHLINEGTTALQVRLALSVWQSHAAREEAEIAVLLPPHSLRSLPTLAMFNHFTDLTEAYRFGPAAHRAVQVRLLDQTGQELASHWHLAPGWGAAATRGVPEDLGLVATGRHLDSDTIDLTVGARRLALHVQLQVPGWLPEDDFFHLPPGRARRVRLRRDPAVEAPVSWQGWVTSLQADRLVAIPAPVPRSVQQAPAVTLSVTTSPTAAPVTAPVTASKGTP